MDKETTDWIDEAIRKCKKAREDEVVLIMQRDRVQGNDDIICCSDPDPEVITALSRVMGSGASVAEEDEDDA